eukprot:749223-Hanusia_phi.AAC.3
MWKLKRQGRELRGREGGRERERERNERREKRGERERRGRGEGEEREGRVRGGGRGEILGEGEDCGMIRTDIQEERMCARAQVRDEGERMRRDEGATWKERRRGCALVSRSISRELVFDKLSPPGLSFFVASSPYSLTYLTPLTCSPAHLVAAAEEANLTEDVVLRVLVERRDGPCAMSLALLLPSLGDLSGRTMH